MGECMLSYESFFLIILISIIGPVIGLLALIFYNMLERQVYLLIVENKQIMLEKELETSRYMQLNHQIQPHFLFNALNSIYGLIRLKKYESLSQSFEHLVLYIRSKYQEKDTLYPLEKEISQTTHFLEIQKLRFGERLSIHWEIDTGLQQALVIPYLLQSLAENAFKHGIEMLEDEVVLEISIKKIVGGKIQLKVKDNGPGFQENPLSSIQNGIGLVNIKRRLNLLFGEGAQISFEFGEGGSVIVDWPLIFNMEVYANERSTVR
jgi:two-component system sensor histidine kinase AlgZ